MNLVKAAIGTAAVITCCLGNEMPAQANPYQQMTEADIAQGHADCKKNALATLKGRTNVPSSMKDGYADHYCTVAIGALMSGNTMTQSIDLANNLTRQKFGLTQ